MFKVWGKSDVDFFVVVLFCIFGDIPFQFKSKIPPDIWPHRISGF
jgi:hypothetical protein